MIKFLALGGITMIPIIIVSMYALAIVIEKIVSFRKYKQPGASFFAIIFDLIKKCDWPRAEKECKRSDSAVAKVWEEGFREANREITDLKAIEEAMQFKGNEIIHNLEMGLKSLASVITLLPLLGLVGTILGLIVAFQKWELMGANVTISDLAGGIYHAMITTATGLVLLVPYYVIYNWLTMKVDTIELELSRRTTEILSRMRHVSMESETAAKSADKNSYAV